LDYLVLKKTYKLWCIKVADTGVLYKWTMASEARRDHSSDQGAFITSLYNNSEGARGKYIQNIGKRAGVDILVDMGEDSPRASKQARYDIMQQSSNDPAHVSPIVEGGESQDMGVPNSQGRKSKVTIAGIQNDIRELSETLNIKLEEMKIDTELRFKRMQKEMIESLNIGIAAAVEKTVKKEMEQFKNLFDTKIDNLNQHIKAVEEKQDTRDAQVYELEDRVEMLDEFCAEEENRQMSIVMFGVPEADYENVENKANAVLKEGLKLDNVRIRGAVRKPSYKPNKPGVIVARCKCKADKDVIMKNKSKLRDSAVYRGVVIVPDKTKEQRIAENNARILANVFDDKLQMRGPRLVKKAETRNQLGNIFQNGR
jgi:hypothetical protein